MKMNRPSVPRNVSVEVFHSDMSRITSIANKQLKNGSDSIRPRTVRSNVLRHCMVGHAPSNQSADIKEAIPRPLRRPPKHHGTMGRTGTLSLKVALEQIGFGPCHHMAEVFKDKNAQAPFFLDAESALQENPEAEVDWDLVYGESRAVCDFPTCLYYKSLKPSIQKPR